VPASRPTWATSWSRLPTRQPLRAEDPQAAVLDQRGPRVRTGTRGPWWGFTLNVSWPLSITLGIGTPLAAAVLWGAYAAPKARFTLPLIGVLGVKALVFGAAAVVLAAIGHHTLALWFAGIVLVNIAVATLLRSRVFGGEVGS
jgi:Protein of unknown function (DUF2568)